MDWEFTVAHPVTGDFFFSLFADGSRKTLPAWSAVHFLRSNRRIVSAWACNPLVSRVVPGGLCIPEKFSGVREHAGCLSARPDKSWQRAVSLVAIAPSRLP